MITMTITKFTFITAIGAGVLLFGIIWLGPSPSRNDQAFGVVPAAAAAAPGIQLALTVSERQVEVRAPVMLRGVVTDSTRGNPVSGATVSFNISRPGGTTTITVNADQQGVAEWKYKAQHEGVYSITAKASAAEFTATTGPVTFAAKGLESPVNHEERSVPSGLIAQSFD
jgi:hypothetical protein